jgi:hypothetical protein
MSDADPSSPDPVVNTQRPRPGGAGAAPSASPGGLFTEGPNARSKSITVADGHDTFGVSLLLLRREMRDRLIVGPKLSSFYSWRQIYDYC